MRLSKPTLRTSEHIVVAPPSFGLPLNNILFKKENIKSREQVNNLHFTAKLCDLFYQILFFYTI